MTTGIAITITDKGRAALVAASGTNAVTISAIGISATAVTPTVTATTLPGEIKRLSTFAGTVTDADTIHITIRDDSADSYALRAFALYLSDGTLFGIYGGDTLFMEKATGAMLMLAVDIQITGSDVTAITFGDTNFLNPAATTEVQGVVELATEAEATTGTDAKRAVTPKGMMAAVKSWLDARFGEGAPSAFVKGLLASASAAALRTALEIKSAALQEASAFVAAASYTAADVLAKLQTVDGSGSGLDADTLDGKHATSFAQLSGATFTGAIAATGSGEALRLSGSYGGGIALVDTNGTGRIYMTDSSKINFAVSSTFPGKTGNAYIDTTGIYYGGNVVWHAGNDGAGSGMDADMLDGYHAASFLRSTGSWIGGFDSYGYAFAFDYSVNGGDITFMTKNSTLSTLIDGDYFAGEGGGFYSGGPTTRIGFYNNGGRAHFECPVYSTSRIAVGWDSGENNAISCSGWFRSYGDTGWYNQTYAGGWYMSDTTWIRVLGGKGVYTPDVMRADIGFNIGGNYWCWHSGNDGHGSGLDADTLDGHHASDFVLSALQPSITGTTNDASTHGEATTAWSGDKTVTIRTGQALVMFVGNWRTNTGPYYAQLYVDGAAWPGAWSQIGALDGSDDVMAPCVIGLTVTGLSAGDHTFAVKRTTGSTLTIYGGGGLSVLQI